MPSPTLILLHGATINGHMWDPVRRNLDARYRVIAPDLPGHGSRRTEGFTLEAAVATVLDAVREAAGSPVVLAGDSLGGYTAMASADAIPSVQLKGLLLGGCSSNLQGAALLPYYWQMALTSITCALRDEQSVIRSAVPKLLSDMRIPAADIEAMIAAGMSLSVFGQCVRALQNVDFRTKLAAIEQPVLIVNGLEDRGHMRQESGFTAVARDATVHHFARCQHGVTLRRPAECAALLNGFAARVFS